MSPSSALEPASTAATPSNAPGIHEGSFHPDGWQIITVDGTDAGILIVEYRTTEIYLGRIELHPYYQGRGIGAQLIQSLVDTAAQRDQDLVLDVLAVNTRAHAFYQRHGFREVSRHGDNNRKIRMRLTHQQTNASGPLHT